MKRYFRYRYIFAALLNTGLKIQLMLRRVAVPQLPNYKIDVAHLQPHD